MAVHHGDDAERAALALRLAHDSWDPAAQERLQQRKTVMIRVRISVVLGGALLGVLLAESFHHHGRRPPASSVAPWRTVLGPIVMVAGLILELIVILWRFRSGQFKAGWRSPALLLSRRQRRGILRQIRGRATVEAALLPVTRQVATLTIRQRSITGLSVALLLMVLGQALPTNDAVRWWFAILLVVLYAVITGMILRDASAAERFLTRHPEPPPPAPAPGSPA